VVSESHLSTDIDKHGELLLLPSENA